MSATAIASEVTGYTAPESGQAATAAGVDANFQALISTINDNNERVSALEAASGEAVDLSDIISGSTYQLFFSGGIIELDQGGGANLEHYAGATFFTFNADGSLEEVFNERGRFISLDQNTNCDENGFNCEHYVDTWQDNNEVDTGSWSVSGQNVNVTWSDGSSDTFKPAADGEIIMGGGSKLDEGGHVWSGYFCRSGCKNCLTAIMKRDEMHARSVNGSGVFSGRPGQVPECMSFGISTVSPPFPRTVWPNKWHSCRSFPQENPAPA
ncbi:hypothetical protein [Alcanivorax borkumensis]|jgi:hypothetical protein|uniref:Uncharacterized protein n=1 Tax=Alcanivorax borkumensis (strain ATCC 700651 / DSM 11573 / NCIMB 13689 / SK2) TaxID=393595 RepID=Q0VL59_ALCBS|nr:hypothetical protein [Alcanivorax borkumensis]CAL18089.1 outermembrane hypothetical protein [Alcanivorax borkumensis SK2]